MMTNDIDVPAMRDVLVTAANRDLRRRAKRRATTRLTALAVTAVMATTGVAAATGVLFSAPKPDNTVPVVAQWTYFSHNPYGAAHSQGPVLLREKTAALTRDNAVAEKALAAAGTTARCGTDPGHPHACFEPSGDPVPAAQMGPALGAESDNPADYDIRSLTPDSAHAWLCAHPEQRPGADFGEKAAPTAGYGDC